jgi:pyruvate dehydrogenase E2 component (dihydrolipoamide acetyltransferase)
MPEVVMPRLSDSMEEGTIVRWLKQDGDQVAEGEPLAEVETDKATVTFDADAGGTLRILVGEGETVPIGRPIAQIGEGAAPTAPAPTPTPTPTPAPPSPRAENGRPKASPLARRLARESGVELSQLSGSGPGGRIVKADVHAAVPKAPQPARGNKGAVTIQQPSRIQTQIAQRMAESKATIPDFTIRAEVDMDRAVEMRSQLDSEPLPTYNDMVLKACAIALREHPRANGAYRDGAFELYERINVGVAVATKDSLIVPTVVDADGKSLLEISREVRRLAARVRSGEVTPAELSGGTFTVSNLGMYGVSSFHAIINPPQAAILAVGEVRETPVVRDGQIVPGHRMTIALTCDHRILYGAPAAEFLARVRTLLERPVNLLI